MARSGGAAMLTLLSGRTSPRVLSRGFREEPGVTGDERRGVRARILVTGASSGLGAGMARAWAAQGRALALCARRLDRLEALRDEVVAAAPGARVVVHRLDVDDHDRVPEVFRAAEGELGGLDRVVVNAGIGRGRPIGTGGFTENRATAVTNFVSALAQCEAALEVFRRQGHGHLVVMSSFSAFRGFGGSMTTYAATKAGVAALAEGIRMETLGTPIRVTTLFPGYISTEINAGASAPFMVDTDTGVAALVAAVEREKAEAVVPPWPWGLLRPVVERMPLALLRRLT